MKKKKSKKKSIQPPRKTHKRGRLSQKQLRIYALVAVLIMTSISYYAVFDSKLDLNGDNTAYYLLGKSIINGDGFSSIWAMGQRPHTHYPVGYPLLIAVFMIFSTNILFIKFINFVFFLLAIVLLFLFTENIFESLKKAFWISLLIGLNSSLLHYSAIMMSEISFLLFSFAVLYLLAKLEFTANPLRQPRLFGLIIVLAYSYHIKSIGIAMIMGVTIYLVVQKHWKYLATILGGTILLLIPWGIRNAGSGQNSYIKPLLMVNPYRPEMGPAGIFDFISRFVNNLTRYISQEIPNAALPYLQSVTMKHPVWGWIAGLIFLSFAAYGLYRLSKQKLMISFYLLGVFGILMLWPDVWTGIRFVLPVLPLLVALAVNGLFEAAEQMGQKVQGFKNAAVALILLWVVFSFASISEEAERADQPYPPAYKNYINIARWVKKNTPEDTRVCCRKETLFYIYAERQTAKYLYTLNDKELLENLAQRKFDYVVLEQLGYSSTGRYLYPAIQKNPQRFTPVLHLKNPDTYLLKFNRGE